MKRLLGLLLMVGVLVGCGGVSPTDIDNLKEENNQLRDDIGDISSRLDSLSQEGSEENSQLRDDILDTTTKEESGTYTILRWDGENWIYTADKLAVSLTWRFISHIEYDDGSVRIKGGYTLDFSNPSDNDVEFGLNKLVFRDKDDIPIHIPYQPIYEDNSFSRIKRNVRANSTDTYSDAFEIELDNIDIAEQIVIMDVWATVAVI